MNVLVTSLFNVFKQKTVFSKVIVIRCYKMVFCGFGKFHQKEFSALPPFFQLLLPVSQLTQVIFCARAFEESETRGRILGVNKHNPSIVQLMWNVPLANFESAGGESVLPAVLIILGVENSLLVFFWSDVLLPLLLTVAVFTTQPTMIASLQKQTCVLILMNHLTHFLHVKFWHL